MGSRSRALLGKRLGDARDALLKMLPVRMGPRTMLVGVTIEGNRLIREYDLDIVRGRPPRSPAQVAELQEALGAKICQIETMRMDIDAGIVFGHQYRDAATHERLFYLETASCPPVEQSGDKQDDDKRGG